MSTVTKDITAYQDPETSTSAGQQAYSGNGSSSLNDLTSAQVAQSEKIKTELFGGSMVGGEGVDLVRGFAPEQLDGANERQDDDGTNYVGNPFEREGFLSPGLGYSR